MTGRFQKRLSGPIVRAGVGRREEDRQEKNRGAGQGHRQGLGYGDKETGFP